MIRLLLPFLLAAAPLAAFAQYDQGVSSSPTPIIELPPAPVSQSPSVVEGDTLSDYEDFISGFSEGSKPSPAPALPALVTGAEATPAKVTNKASPAPVQKQNKAKVYNGLPEVKRGMSVEKGVKVYRGATP